MITYLSCLISHYDIYKTYPEMIKIKLVHFDHLSFIQLVPFLSLINFLHFFIKLVDERRGVVENLSSLGMGLGKK